MNSAVEHLSAIYLANGYQNEYENYDNFDGSTVQRYLNFGGIDFSGTTDKSYSYFLGKEIISFNHIIDASNNKCFYFLDDDNNKIYPDQQESGDFFAWPPWRIHGVDKVQEPNVNRLIVAGNIWLDSYVKSPPPDDVYNAMVRTLN